MSSPSSESPPMPIADWTTLMREWQQLSAAWGQWWSSGMNAARIDPAQWTKGPLPVPDMEWHLLGNTTIPKIDPAVVSALTQRFNERLFALWQATLTGRIQEPGRALIEAPPNDRRFTGPEWQSTPYYAWLKQSYLLYADYLQALVAAAELPAADKRRLKFTATQFIDAISPSNFFMTNPEAIKRAIETDGASVTQGMQNLLTDARKGHISMTDEEAFVVGENLAVSPGSVVYRNDLIEVIQYQPTTAKVFARPLVLVPPCINKFYILDLKPENSFVRYAVAAGHTVFMLSWRNIPPELGHLTWDNYVADGVLQAIEVARKISGSDVANVLGFCVGGTLVASALAVLAARRQSIVESVTLLTTMVDFADPGEICVYLSPEWLASREPELLAGGRVRGSELASAFASLRANELVWNYVVNNYLKGQSPPAFDLLFWNSDGTNLPGPMYVQYIREMYVNNRLKDKNALTMCGEPIDVSSIELPAYIYASREDHIVPWKTAYRTTKLLSGKLTFVLGASGHIAGVVNPPEKHRRNYWTNAHLSEDAEAWERGAAFQAGSWWPHWAQWLQRHAGKKRLAPTTLGNAAFPPLDPAPGRYVLEPAG